MKVVLGCMTFGKETTEAAAGEIMDAFADKYSMKELDTANIQMAYGESERIIGTYLSKKRPQSFSIATKANPWTGSFSTQGIKDQCAASSKVLQRDPIDIYYLHFPDYVTPIEDTLRGINDLHKEGKIKEFGLSNFAAWHVMDVYRICEKNSYVLPTVYQGQYNALSRANEDELFPCLRRLNIRFYVHSPLAGGFLTGKFKFTVAPTEGRFVGSRAQYQGFYWKKEYFDALDVVRQGCDKEGITMTEASLRWLTCHSKLDASLGDAIIIGASKMEYLISNMEGCLNGKKLPQDIVDAFEKAWDVTKRDNMGYFMKPKE